ncbi:NADH dehydrogenase [ubiquinone] 1 beta subcomplex subunit 8, mitochondrial [Choanephora cucurbitarum]|uniref:NADH dehydrogenase [ubiquinone] 1 beta subcomplex subunit 8, mitochondrial n=1 Tax=Choanephora cucurbitarum TaxID=101091 RepID=A0A1C7N782_9FUNG|nr:NADH dehydrogenase [ubiquinone] 1 beta subcomplex subunit 8, mitochondrial [Choanephora cucurbitarum]
MAFRAATQRALNVRAMMNITRQPIAVTSVRPQSTLSTGEVIEDPQIGDYPNLPRISAQERGPFGWDDPQDKRNFGEPVHEEDEIMGVWAPDLHTYSPHKAAAQLALAFGIFGGIATLVYKTYPESPVVKRTYPYNGLTEEFGERETDTRPRAARAGEQ